MGPANSCNRYGSPDPGAVPSWAGGGQLASLSVNEHEACLFYGSPSRPLLPVAAVAEHRLVGGLEEDRAYIDEGGEIISMPPVFCTKNHESNGEGGNYFMTAYV